ncbi:MAG: hypothetical protein AB1486_06585 [Planctomycetota bacterium]
MPAAARERPSKRWFQRRGAAERGAGEGRAARGAIARAAAGALVTVALVGSAISLVTVSRMSLRAEGVFRLDPGQCRVEAHPAWFSAEALEEVRASLRALGPFDLDAPRAATLLAESIRLGCPWVRDVRALEKIYPQQARLELTLRRPVAKIALQGQLVALDAEGVVLPPSALGFASPNGDPLPRLVGVRGLPCPPAGIRIPSSAEVVEGLAVAVELGSRRLGSRQDPVHIVAIDVTGVPSPESGGRVPPGRCEIILQTQSGAEIWWGRSGASEPLGAVESTVEEKIARLNWVLRRYPALRGLQRVVVFYDDPTVIKAEEPRQVKPDGG